MWRNHGNKAEIMREEQKVRPLHTFTGKKVEAIILCVAILYSVCEPLMYPFVIWFSDFLSNWWLMIYVGVNTSSFCLFVFFILNNNLMLCTLKLAKFSHFTVFMLFFLRPSHLRWQAMLKVIEEEGLIATISNLRKRKVLKIVDASSILLRIGDPRRLPNNDALGKVRNHSNHSLNLSFTNSRETFSEVK